MELHDLISPSRIFVLETENTDKEQLLRTLLLNCLNCDKQGTDFDIVWPLLWERERSMSTGIGQGVAIPHCSTEKVTDVKGILAVLRKPIDFQALDDEPVHLVVLMLMPKNKFDRHIKTLATVARTLNDAGFRQRVLEAQSAEAVYTVLRGDSAESTEEPAGSQPDEQDKPPAPG